VFLDKLPLRRTFKALNGFTWASFWKLGGNPFELRYKLFYRQFESLNRLSASLAAFPRNGTLGQRSSPDILRWSNRIDEARPSRLKFSKWYSRHWDNWNERDLSSFEEVQEAFARIAGLVLTEILVPFWRIEQEPLVVVSSQEGAPAVSESKHHESAAGLEPYITNAEVTVCLVFLGFIQNILGRMRSLVMGIICLFLSIALLIPSYPFDPRPFFTGAVIVLFGVVGIVVFTVYSQVFRDATLSHLTNTNPGELGLDFWLKVAGFGIGPALGLLATTFPELSAFFWSWLQPSVSSMK
jgi:hypothetical protein